MARLVFDTKYDTGDTVYQIFGWIGGARIVERKITGIVGIVNGDTPKYSLEPQHQRHTASWLNEAPEPQLYATREEAAASAAEKYENFKRRERERAEADLAELEARKAEAISEATAEIDEEITAAKNRLEQL